MHVEVESENARSFALPLRPQPFHDNDNAIHYCILNFHTKLEHENEIAKYTITFNFSIGWNNAHIS